MFHLITIFNESSPNPNPDQILFIPFHLLYSGFSLGGRGNSDNCQIWGGGVLIKEICAKTYYRKFIKTKKKGITVGLHS